MSARLLLVGPLADPAMMAALGLEPAGAAVTLPGLLSGGGRAGIARDGWPGWDREAQGQVIAQPVEASDGLRRYAEIMDLQPVEGPEGRVIGAVLDARP